MRQMKDKLNHLIIGYGEVGRGLAEVLKKGSNVWILDPYKRFNKNDSWPKKFDAVHICFPFSKKFLKAVWDLKKKHKHDVLIIHSTVPVGISDKLGAVHSPIRGDHPRLARAIKIFVKYVGGKNAKKAAKLFERYGIKTKLLKNARDSEALKLWDTTQYGWMIILNKEIWDWCQKNRINFDMVYRDANQTYNAGYLDLGKNNVIRPVLKYMPGPIGGHCVIPNCNLLDSSISKIIKKINKKTRKQKK